MYAKIVNAVLNWALTAIIMPIIYVVVDYLRLKKKEKEANKAAQDLKNAKTKSDINSSVDNIS